MKGKTTHGGARPGSGRPSKGRIVRLSIKVSEEAALKLKDIMNKSEYIDRLIREA